MTSMNSRVIDLYHSNRSGTPGRTAANLFLNQQVTQAQQSEVQFLAPISHTSEPHQVEEEEEKVSEEQNEILNIVEHLQSDTANHLKENVHFETVLFTESLTDGGMPEAGEERKAYEQQNQMFPIKAKVSIDKAKPNIKPLPIALIHQNRHMVTSMPNSARNDRTVPLHLR